MLAAEAGDEGHNQHGERGEQRGAGSCCVGQGQGLGARRGGEEAQEAGECEGQGGVGWLIVRSGMGERLDVRGLGQGARRAGQAIRCVSQIVPLSGVNAWMHDFTALSHCLNAPFFQCTMAAVRARNPTPLDTREAAAQLRARTCVT